MITFYKFKDASGQEQGPVSESALHGLRAADRIGEETPVLDLGTGQWQAYRDLAPPPPAPTPELPPPLPAPRPMPPSAPSAWTPPPSALQSSERESRKLDHWDWIIFAGAAIFMLISSFLGQSRQPRVSGDAAYQAGQTCGTFLAALLFPALFLLLRRWWGRLVSALGCFGFWMILGIGAAIALPALLATRHRARLKAHQPMTLTPRTPAPWLSLQLPGQYSEVPIVPPNAMVAQIRKAVAVEGDFRVEVQLLEMAPGYRVIPENAIQGQNKALLANPPFPGGDLRPSEFVHFDAGRGQSFDYVVTTPEGPMLLRSVVLAFPADAENPTQGLILVMHGQGPETDLRAQMARITDSIRYTPR